VGRGRFNPGKHGGLDVAGILPLEEIIFFLGDLRGHRLWHDG